MTDRNFKQEFLDACADDPSIDDDHAYSYATSLKPTGGENISMLQNAYLFATLESSKFDMNDWVSTIGYDDLYDDEVGASKPTLTKENVVSCGTTFCLAGSVAAFNLGDNEGMDCDGNIYNLKKINNVDYLGSYVDSSEDRGTELMNLNDDQAHVLFYLPNDINVIKAALNYVAQRDLGVKETINV